MNEIKKAHSRRIKGLGSIGGGSNSSSGGGEVGTWGSGEGVVTAGSDGKQENTLLITFIPVVYVVNGCTLLICK